MCYKIFYLFLLLKYFFLKPIKGDNVYKYFDNLYCGDKLFKDFIVDATVELCKVMKEILNDRLFSKQWIVIY